VVEAFVDTNVLIYLISEDDEKARKAEGLLADGPTISVQVLNEFTNVALRKLALSWREIDEALSILRRTCRIEPLTLETHRYARRLAERYGYRIFDGSILGAAILARCETVYSEDMQHGQVIERMLTIRNPFV
jgi:predicted nucleic acid-binding protein